MSPTLRKGTNPGHVLQWLNVQKSVALGLGYFVLGGLADLPGSGLDKFEIRMGGTRLMFPGWLELAASSWHAQVFGFPDRGYRRVYSFVTRQ